MKPIHFYHVYAGADAWLEPAEEHFRALHESEFDGPVFAAIIGNATQAHEVRTWLEARDIEVQVFTQAIKGHEQVTLRYLHEVVRSLPDDQPVLYAHTKGSAPDPADSKGRRLNQKLWRRCMTRAVAGQWRTCVEDLKNSDAVGCHWLTPEFAAGYGLVVDTPFFAGNFWWATTGYLKRLPPPQNESRFDAESWIGLGSPRVIDLAPGFIDHVITPLCTRGNLTDMEDSMADPVDARFAELQAMGLVDADAAGPAIPDDDSFLPKLPASQVLPPVQQGRKRVRIVGWEVRPIAYLDDGTDLEPLDSEAVLVKNREWRAFCSEGGDSIRKAIESSQS